jgi:Phosphoesterase family
MQSQSKTLRTSLVAVAVATAIGSTSAFAANVSIVQGTVGGASLTAPVFVDAPATGTGSTTSATVYGGATVFFDLNGNGVLDPGEPSTTTAANGTFKLLSTKGVADLVALIPATTTATVTSSNATSTSRNVFRAKAAQVLAATVSPTVAATVDITPLSTEVGHAVDFTGVTYQQAVNNLAQRIGVSAADVLTAPTLLTNATELPAILKESVIDTGRFQLAAKFIDRGDTIGELRGNFDCPNISSPAVSDTSEDSTSDGCTGTDLNTPSTIWQAQDYAENLEGMPRYDYVFVIILENESLSSLKGAKGVPYLNAFINQGNQYYDYFATGDPSEPNYIALGGADDFGITGDEPSNLPYPSVTGVRQNLFNSLDAHGLSWHVYEESLWPSPAGTEANVGASSWNAATGGAFFDNPGDSSIKPATTGQNAGNTDTSTYPTSALAKKHQPAVWYADVTSQPNYLSNSRTVSGEGTDVNGNAIPYAYASSDTSTGADDYKATGEWDAGLQAYATAGAITSWWNGQPWTQDQFLQDLQTSGVANYNFIVPDIKDDGHDTGVNSRMDYFTQKTVAKIQSSAIWNDPTKRVAIVVTFDEGESNVVPDSCCGWNPNRGGTANPVAMTVANNGTVSFSAGSQVSGVSAFNGTTYGPTGTENLTYNNGNRGHGITLFGLQTNQQALSGAPAGLYDTDYYSHFSFVRSLQDIFGVADPGQPGTYANRSKYTENFIEANATLLPEFASSSNPHFDAVRAMNHVYAFPAGATHVAGAGGVASPPVTVGPDANQTNLWSTTP